MRWAAPLAALALLGAAPPRPVPTPAYIASLAHAQYFARQSDRFSPRLVDDALAGTPFTVTIKPGDGQALNGNIGAFYAYSDDALQLVLPSTIVTLSRDSGNINYLNVLAFAQSRRDMGRTIGTNSYGARIPFTHFSVSIDGLALVGVDGFTNFSFRKTMDGPAARRLALGSRFVVKGKITALPDRHIAGCAPEFIAATVQSPTEVSILNCWVGATIDSVDLIGPDGPLQHWDGLDAVTYLAGAKIDPARISGLVTASDYPPGETTNGTTIVHVTVDEAGRVSDCAMRTSSGSARLDELACTLIRRRGRFPPQASEFDAPIHWQRE